MTDFDRTHNNTRFWAVIDEEYPLSSADAQRAERDELRVELVAYLSVPLEEHVALGFAQYDATEDAAGWDDFLASRWTLLDHEGEDTES